MRVVTLHKYRSDVNGDLNFASGVTINVVGQREDGWWKGYLESDDRQQVGWFPSNFVKPIETERQILAKPETETRSQLSSATFEGDPVPNTRTRSVRNLEIRKSRLSSGVLITDSLVKVKHNFTARDSSELTISIGELLTLYVVHSDGWCEGQNSKGEYGSFPHNHVQEVPRPEPSFNDNDIDDDDTLPTLLSPFSPHQKRNSSISVQTQHARSSGNYGLGTGSETQKHPTVQKMTSPLSQSQSEETDSSPATRKPELSFSSFNFSSNPDISEPKSQPRRSSKPLRSQLKTKKAKTRSQPFMDNPSRPGSQISSSSEFSSHSSNSVQSQQQKLPDKTLGPDITASSDVDQLDPQTQAPPKPSFVEILPHTEMLPRVVGYPHQPNASFAQFLINVGSIKSSFPSDEELFTVNSAAKISGWGAIQVSNPTTMKKGLRSFTVYEVSTTPHFITASGIIPHAFQNTQPQKQPKPSPSNQNPKSSHVCTVTRRYSDFDWLRTQLLSTFPMAFIPLLPKKKFSGRFDSDFLSRRTRALQRWLLHIAYHPLLRNSIVLTLFLTVNNTELEHLKKSKHLLSFSFDSLQFPLNSVPMVLQYLGAHLKFLTQWGDQIHQITTSFSGLFNNTGQDGLAGKFNAVATNLNSLNQLIMNSIQQEANSSTATSETANLNEPTPSPDPSNNPSVARLTALSTSLLCSANLNHQYSCLLRIHICEPLEFFHDYVSAGLITVRKCIDSFDNASRSKNTFLTKLFKSNPALTGKTDIDWLNIELNSIPSINSLEIEDLSKKQQKAISTRSYCFGITHLCLAELQILSLFRKTLLNRVWSSFAHHQVQQYTRAAQIWQQAMLDIDHGKLPKNPDNSAKGGIVPEK